MGLKRRGVRPRTRRLGFLLMGALPLGIAGGASGCGPSVAQIRSQAATQLFCLPEQVVMTDLPDERWWITGCGRQVFYACRERDKLCRLLPLDSLRPLLAQLGIPPRPTTSVPEQPPEPPEPPRPWQPYLQEPPEPPESQQQRAWQPYPQPQQPQSPMPRPNPLTDIIMPGSYNPRTGTMQTSYSNQYYKQQQPPPPLPPLSPRRY